MSHFLIQFFTSFPPDLGTLLMAMLPVAERFALPVSIAVFKEPAGEAFVLVLLGNMVPVITILALAETFHTWISKHAGIFGKAWAKSINHAQTKFARYEKYGLIGLLIFVAIPTPLNGAFTASLVAFILGYPLHRSLPYLFAGIVIANCITLALTVGAVKLF